MAPTGLVINVLRACFNCQDNFPVSLYLDALDEWPSITGTPSAHEEVLNFVEDLFGQVKAIYSRVVQVVPTKTFKPSSTPLDLTSWAASLPSRGAWVRIVLALAQGKLLYLLSSLSMKDTVDSRHELYGDIDIVKNESGDDGLKKGY